MINNKRSLLLSLTAGLFFLPLVSQANTLRAADFRDHFTLSMPLSAKILEVRTVGNLKYISETDSSFILADADPNLANSGDLIIVIGYDVNNKCTLTIHDGAFEMNPTVTNIEKVGSKPTYVGIDHNFGTFEYNLKFK